MQRSCRIVFVLGMHRSGTSALAGLLAKFGVHPGANLLPANESNPHGYFESRDVVDINNEILTSIGSSWDGVGALPAGWSSAPILREAREKLTSLLSSLTTSDSVQVIKDPRLCRTLPIWLEVLQDLGIPAGFVICQREPEAVAQSQQLMKGIPYLKSLMLYMHYTLDAELHTRSCSRVVVTYSEILDDPVGLVSRIFSELELGAMSKDESLMDKAAEFISPSLNHSRATDGDFQRCGTLALMASSLCSAVKTADRDALDALRSRYEAYVSDMGPWVDMLEHLQTVESLGLQEHADRRYGMPRLRSRLYWSDSADGPFDGRHKIVNNWVLASGIQSITFKFNRSGAVQRLRLLPVDRPAYIHFQSVRLERGSELLCEWKSFSRQVPELLKGAICVSGQRLGETDGWIFFHENGHIDLGLPGVESVMLDEQCALKLELIVSDMSTGMLPLNSMMQEVRQETSLMRQLISESSALSASRGPTANVVNDLMEVRTSLQAFSVARNAEVRSQREIFARLQHEMLRAEAQLSLLKELSVSALAPERL